MGLVTLVFVLLAGWCAAAPAPVPDPAPDPAHISDPAHNLDPSYILDLVPEPLPAHPDTFSTFPAAIILDGDPHVRQERAFHPEERAFHPEENGGGGVVTSSTTRPPTTTKPPTTTTTRLPTTTRPPFTTPTTTRPPFTMPTTTRPPFTMPTTTRPPFTMPTTTRPPFTMPTTTRPPFTMPATTRPPFTRPPTTKPPFTRPPTFRPPLTRPPLTRPITSPPIPGSASSISPYYADPEGRPAPPPPTLGQELAPPPPPCSHMETTCDPSSPYRTFNGRCNNLQHPDFGAAGHAFITLVPPKYDPPAVFRYKSVRGGLLPNPRLLSLLLRHMPEGHQQPINALFVQMGQFIDHDFAVTTVVGSMGDPGPSCRPCSSWVNSPCAPIPIPVNDPYIPAFTQDSGQPRCLPFTRSVAHLTRDGHGHRSLHQVNMNTAFIDMAPIYGNEACTAALLRERYGGRLKSDANQMPERRPAKEFIVCRSDDGHCYLSGDQRANENLGLTVLHVVFHRAHNNLADALKTINPHWDDERLFQEARRINVARFQNLVYREYVPALLGYHTAARHQLIPHHEGYFLDYNVTVNPAIYNDFTTAAFRMGHSQVPKFFYLLDEYYRVFGQVPLFQTYFNTSLLAQYGTFDPLLRGLLGISSRPTDLSFVDDLNNKLFIRKDDPLSGHDLFAINTARGRDHGLAPYVKYLSQCGIKAVSSFADLKSLMPSASVDMLSQAYADVWDIDLFVGGLSELPLPGAMVGPTFSCIMARQFTTSKIGDRFWFEGPGAGFTLDQLHALRQSSMASILCEAMDHPDPLVPAQAFHLPDQHSNPLRRCSEFHRIDVGLWRELPFSLPTPCRHLGDAYHVGRPVPVSPCQVCVCQRDGEMWCRCNLSGCSEAPQDNHCRRICGHTNPSPQLSYLQ